MDIQLVRHATLLITYNNKTILVDPMLSKKGAMDPIPLVPNQNRNPIVELPLALSVLCQPDTILLTHGHRDHFDEEAARLLPKDLSFFCPPQDVGLVKGKGFKNVREIKDTILWEGIEFLRTGGKHGTGVIGKTMGPVSGYILRSPGEPALYIAGDTIWCREVEEAIEVNRPDVIVCFSGAARFCTGDPITMDEKDIEKVCKKALGARVIAVHLEAWNHCRLTRDALGAYLKERDLVGNVSIPLDGEKMFIC